MNNPLFQEWIDAKAAEQEAVKNRRLIEDKLVQGFEINEAFEGAYLEGANLRGANLRGAALGADCEAVDCVPTPIIALGIGIPPLLLDLNARTSLCTS